MASRGVAFGAIAAGGVLAYAGIRGYSVTQTLQQLVTGKSPVTQAQVTSVTTPAGGASGSTGGGGGGGGVAPAGPGEKAFFTAVCVSMLAPPSAANLHSLSAWRVKETPWPPVAKNNPLNTTQSMPGTTNYNSVGVKNYPTETEGVTATARTLMNGNYPAIVSALRSGRGVCGSGFASEFSTWSGGGYTSVC